MKKIFLLFCIFLSAPVWSQTVNVEVLVTTNRMLSRLDELEELATSGQLIIRLRNSSALRQNVQLEMRLTSPQTPFSIRTNENAAPSFFSVNAFDSRTLTVSDLNELFDQNSFALGDGRTLAEFLAGDPTGQVPSGQYRLCVGIVPQSLTPPHSTSFQSEGCTTITFQQFNPPVISLINNYPYSEGATVPSLRNPNAPFPITFTPPISVLTNPVNVLFNYTLCVVELFENDQRDPNQVLRSVIDGKEPRGVVVRKEILNSPAGQAQITVNLLPVDFSVPFRLAQNYAVAVLAELQGATTAELPNGGLSPICSFQYGRRTVVNRPLTGRRGQDEFIRILNSLDAPDKSTQELFDQAFAELGRRTVAMKATKVCYSVPNAVSCIKLDSVYDARFTNPGVNKLIKLITNDLADDLGQGDAFNVCGNGSKGSIKGLNMQRVEGLTAGISGFIQKPSSKSVTDRLISTCGETAASGGNNTNSSGECTDCSIDPEIANAIATGTVDQLDPLVQSINELFAGCSPSGDSGINHGANGAIASEPGEGSSIWPESTGTADPEEVLGVVNNVKTAYDAVTEGIAKNGRGVAGVAGGVATTVGGEFVPEETQGVVEVAQGAITIAEGIEGFTVLASEIATGGFAAVTAGAVFGAVLVGGAAYFMVKKFGEGLDAEQAAREERVRKSNEYYRNRNGTQLTTGDVNKNLQERQARAYDLKKRFGRLGWGDVFGGGGSSNPTGTGPGSGKNVPPNDVSGFACKMVDKCNQDGWGSPQCRGFMASFNCIKNVDSRMIYTDPTAFNDGGGCGTGGNPKFRCAEEAVGQPATGSANDPCNKFAANRDFLSRQIKPGGDPRLINPVGPGMEDPGRGGGKKGSGPDPRLNPQSTNNPQPVLGGQSSPTTPADTIPKPAIDKPALPRPNNNPGQNPDPNKNRNNR